MSNPPRDKTTKSVSRGPTASEIPRNPLSKRLPLFALVLLVAVTLPRQFNNVNSYLDSALEVDEYQDSEPEEIQSVQLEVATKINEEQPHRDEPVKTFIVGVPNSSLPISSSDYHAALANMTIRKWGCQRNESPTFFVHIGKAGGGMVRARFAAAAINYERDKWWAPGRDNHYYPVSQHHNGSFCNAMASNMEFPLPGRRLKSLEGTYPCAATSPIASAVACPDPKASQKRCWGCQDLSSRHCHTVYVGHNFMGHEMNFLPPSYLEDWWKSTRWGQQFQVDWSSLHQGNRTWCKVHNQSRPMKKGTYRGLFQKCQKPIAESLDKQFEAFWSKEMFNSDPRDSRGGRPMLNYAPLYASLPVHRATVVREPFSWLVSRYSWHNVLNEYNQTCDDIVTATTPPTGWAYYYSMSYVLYLCGQDCYIRLDRGLITLEELEMQATMNLRKSFSVVGLLNESDIFYEMVSARIGYMDMSLNEHVFGQSHSSKKDAEIRRCSGVFQDKEFQAKLVEELPILGVLVRLYEVAVQVNRFQRQELRGCSSSKLL